MLRAWLGPFPGPVARMGVDLIRSDPQVSNPFSPTQQVWSTSYYEVSNATSSPVLYLQPQSSGTGQQGRCAPVYQQTFVGDGGICSRAAIRRQRGSGTEEAWVRRFWLGASQEPGPGIILHPGYTLISILRMHLVIPDGRIVVSLLVGGKTRTEHNYKHPMASMPSSLPQRVIQITCEIQDVRAALGPYTQVG